MKTLNVKNWFVAREQKKAFEYHLVLDAEKESDEAGFRKVNVLDEPFPLNETSKAIKVAIHTTNSEHTWNTWIPKSMIA